MEAYKNFSFISKIYDNLKFYYYRHSLPSEPCHDDVWIVAYPKSGISWLGFLMSNVNLLMNSSERHLTWFNQQCLFPDIHVAQSKLSINNQMEFPDFRIIKSHSKYNPFYKQIIYLIRDPRDVMVSNYYYSKNFSNGLSKNVELFDYIKSNNGIKSWNRHVQSWINCQHWHKINYFRYEDLKENPKEILSRIYSLFGYDIPDDILNKSVEYSDIKQMKELESNYNKNSLKYFANRSNISSDAKFVREGKTNGSLNSEIDEEMNNYIWEKSKDSMKIFGYEYQK